MWPYERYLPDYDPRNYADLKREIHNQPILRRRKHGALPLSESEDDSSSARPSAKVGRQFLQKHKDYAHAAMNNLLYPVVAHNTDPHMHVSAHWSKDPQSREEFEEDRTHHLHATRDWRHFREKQIHLHQLFRQLDEVKDWGDRLERQHKHLPRNSSELPELEEELHALQLKEDDIKHKMRALVSPPSSSSRHPAGSSNASSPLTEKDADAERTGLTPAWQEQLAAECKKYNQYAHDRDRALDERRRARLEHQFAAMEAKLKGLQDQLEAVQTERLKQEERYARVRKLSNHAPGLGQIEQRLHALERTESNLESQIRDLLDDPGWPTTCAPPHSPPLGDGSLGGSTLHSDKAGSEDPHALAAGLQHKLEAQHEHYVQSGRDRVKELQNLESRRHKGPEPAEWSDEVTKAFDRIAESSAPDESQSSDEGEHPLLEKKARRQALRERMKAMGAAGVSSSHKSRPPTRHRHR